VLSVLVFLQVSGPEGAAAVYQGFSWIRTGGLDISFGLVVDPLSGVMILVVTGVGTLIHVYSAAYMHEDEGFAKFFAYLNLFMFEVIGRVSSITNMPRRSQASSNSGVGGLCAAR
jgi:NADH-quinone oxidoreductase subunit L